MRGACELPLIDIVEVTAQATRRLRHHPRRVLGTRFTAAGGQFTSALAAHGVEPVLPGPGDQRLIDRLIYQELCLGTVTDQSAAAFADLRERLRSEGADGIVLACTELGLLLSPAERAAPEIVDTVDVHVAALVTASLSRSPS